VFDRVSEIGGTLFSIPDYRLPREVVRGELGRILATGIEFLPNHQLGRDIYLADLQQNFTAVFLAPGRARSGTSMASSPAERAEQPILPVEHRTCEAEIEGGLNANQVAAEAHRCFACGNCMSCDNCWTLAPTAQCSKHRKSPAKGTLCVRIRLLQGLRTVRESVPVRLYRDEGRTLVLRCCPDMKMAMYQTMQLHPVVLYIVFVIASHRSEQESVSQKPQPLCPAE
jgi:hypothetical protein